MTINFIGLDKLGNESVAILTTLFSNYFEKIERDLPDCELNVDVKIHNKEGERKQYEFLVKVIYSGDILTAQAEDWDLRRCIHKVCGKLINEIQHKFKTEGRPKNFK